MRSRTRNSILLALLVGLPLLGGCATVRVQPWERDLLAQPGMQLDENSMLTSLDEHIYFSKEASTGGSGFGGGGCGCN